MPATPPEIPYAVFISYSQREKAWVRGELLPRLESVGLKACIDYRDFRIGAPTVKEMERAVLTSRHTLAVLTPAYLESAWTDFEALLSATLDPGSHEERLLPLLLEPCDLPLRIKYLGYADFTATDDLALAWQRLLTALAAPGAAGPYPPKEPPMDEESLTPSDSKDITNKDVVATTQIDVEQLVETVTGGQVAGVKVDTISGPVTINITGSAPAKTPVPAPESNTAAVRELLLAAFSDEELMTFCFDNFRLVYEDFTTGMSRTQKVQRLMEACDRRGEVAKLLARVERANPYQYARFRDHLRNADPSAKS